MSDWRVTVSRDGPLWWRWVLRREDGEQRFPVDGYGFTRKHALRRAHRHAAAIERHRASRATIKLKVPAGPARAPEPLRLRIELPDSELDEREREAIQRILGARQ